MKVSRARVASGRRARHTLDRARNPEMISLHAIERFLEDMAHDSARALRVESCVHYQLIIQAADQEIRALCAAATQLYRGRDAHILVSTPWLLFYRDRTVVTVLHQDSPRKW